MKTIIYEPFYRSLRNFTILTHELINARAFGLLSTGFNLIERFLEKGDPIVRNAILFRYVPSVYTLIRNCAYKEEVISLLPFYLRKEYEKLVLSEEIKSDTFVFVLHLN